MDVKQYFNQPTNHRRATVAGSFPIDANIFRLVLHVGVSDCKAEKSVQKGGQPCCQGLGHSPSTAFLHLPLNSARFSYATEGALDLYVGAAVHRRGQRPPKSFGTDKTVEAT